MTLMADDAIFIESVLKNHFWLNVVNQSFVQRLNVISYSINKYSTLLSKNRNIRSITNIQIAAAILHNQVSLMNMNGNVALNINTIV